MAQLQSQFDQAKSVEAKVRIAVAGANAIFGECKIKITLVKFEDSTNDRTVVARLPGALKDRDNANKIALLSKLAQGSAKSVGADVGIIITDLTPFGLLDNGTNAAYLGKAKTEDGLMTVQEGGFIGGILMSSDAMTSLTLAHELRVRLAHDDPVHGRKATGSKLRCGVTNDVIRQFPNAKLSTMCDDECSKLRQGLTKLGLISGDPVPGKEYELKIYVSYIGLQLAK